MPLTPEEQHDLQILNAHFGAGKTISAAPMANPQNLSIGQTPAGQLQSFEKNLGANVDYAKDTKKQARDAMIEGMDFINPSYPPTEQSAKAMREMKASYDTLKDLTGGLRQHYNEYGAEIFPQTDAAKVYGSKKAQLLGQLKQMETLGTLDRGVLEFANQLMQEPVGLNATNISGYGKQLDEFSKYLDTTMKNKAASYGYKIPESTQENIIDYKEFFK